MIIIDAGQRTDQSFEARLIFAQSLRRAGYPAVLDDRALPDPLHRTQKYDLASLAVRPDRGAPDGVIVLAANSISDATLASLRSYALEPDRPVVALGRFASRQERLGAGGRIAYAIGREPEVIDLTELQPAPLISGCIAPLLGALHPSDPPVATNSPRLLLYLPGDLAEDPDSADGLAQLDASRSILAATITSASGKAALEARGGPGGLRRVYAYAELAPDTLGSQTDIAVIIGAGSPGVRIGQICAEVLARGGVVIDGTEVGSLAASGAPVVRGPQALALIPGFVEHEILPRLPEIGAEVRASDWTRRNRLENLTSRLPFGRDPGATCAMLAPKGAPERAPRTVFLPTNGVGLGHAQRCALIAREMPVSDAVSFTAFPSCVELIERRGFPCRPLVQKSAAHVDPFANDMVNHRRLGRWLSPGDRLIFDGVFVFDSIYRTIQERGLDATWIRRGLWRTHQTNTAALSREHVFNQVIVPEEAFDELNQHYSFGAHIRHVGPIVQAASTNAARNRSTRAAIVRHLGRDFDRMVVSMLGGGQAADRGPQLQTIAAALEDRPDTLHLVVVWPNAQVAPGLMLWNNTRVVRSLDALRLAQAADLVVTAVGYNSFHEMLYNRIPALFVPQTAPFMDDQERRARSAVDRGLAEMVLPEDLLLLERRLGALIADGGTDELRRRLNDATLRRPGNAEAAAYISGGQDDARRLA